MNDNTKETIILEALKLFNEFGFHGTSTSKIAKAAGVSNGALFNRFKTKDELINGIYMYVKSNFKQYIDSKSDESLEMEESIKSLWKSTVKWGIENPEYLKFQGQFNHSPYINCVSKETSKDTLQVACERKNLLKKNRDISDEDLNLLVICMAGATNALSSYLINNEIHDIDAHMDSVFELLFKGILK